MTKDEAERRGNEASQLLANPLMQEFLIQMEKDIVDGLKRADPRDKEGIAELHRLLRTLEKFRGMFEMAIRDGKFEQYVPPKAISRWLSKMA